MVESTGLFKKREQMMKHINAGAKKVILTVPAGKADDVLRVAQILIVEEALGRGGNDQVADLGALAIDDIVVVSYAETGDGDRKTVHRGAGVAADEVDIIMFARDAHTRVELFDILDREPRRYPQAYGDLRWRSVHGADVGDIDRHGFVAEMTERDVLQVEMNTFEQQIGGNERAFALMVEHSGVIAYGIDG